MTAVKVDVWSDIACPWCWVGKRHLEAAAKLARVTLDVHWHAFELNPAAPTKCDDEVPYVDRLAHKYGVSVDRAQAMIDRMTIVGGELGLEFRFDIAQPTNTFAGHRLLAWAEGSGRQSQLKERLFEAYMRDGLSVSDADVLIDAAVAAGLSGEKAARIVGSNEYAEPVRADETAAAELGVGGVPFFVIAEQFGVQGAQPADALARVLVRAKGQAQAAAAADDELVEGGAPGCDDEGCVVSPADPH